jgi:GNAT superfamily N-acetyltransferase
VSSVATVYADAFVDDPGWVSVGPDSRRRRWNYVRRICGAEVRVAERLGGKVIVGDDDGEPTSAIVYYPPGGKPTSLWLTVAEAPGAALAGPVVVARSLKAESSMFGGHPEEEHLYVSLLAVRPSHQRGGRGRRLLDAALAEADELGVLAHLTTANPANLPYYRQFGFEVTSEIQLPRGAPLWFMDRR